MGRVLGIVGAGRFGRLAANLAEDTANFDEICFFDDFLEVDHSRIVGKIADIDAFISAGRITALIVAVGYKHFQLRQDIFERYRQSVSFATLVHPTSFVSKGAKIDEGVMIYSHCNVEVGASLGPNVTVFNQTSITHDVSVGSHSFLSVGISMGGGVQIGKRVFIGVNSTLVNDIVLGDDCIVCGGTFLTQSIEANSCVIGNPFRMIDKVFL
jgi:sugar O-acyltransferase (sialic acid O-acetyltransferase NeuD family)